MLIEDFTPYVYDVDGDVLYLDYYIGGADDSGTGTVYVDIVDMEVTFTSELNWYGTEYIEFTVSDGVMDDTAMDYVDVIVTPVNDAPTIMLPPEFVFDEDEDLLEDFTQYVYDVEGDPLTLTVANNVDIDAAIQGLFVLFSAPLNWNGDELLTFTIDDGVSEAVNSADVEVIVNPVNDAPTINLPASFTLPEDSQQAFDFSPYVDDIDGDDLTLYAEETTDISVSFVGLVAVIQGNEDWNGTEAVTFVVDDGDVVTEAIASDITDIIVTPVNDPPEIVLPDDFTFDEDTSLLVDFTQYITDLENNTIVLTSAGNTDIIVDIDGLDVTFSAPPDWNGEETITFVADDGVSDAISIDNVLVIVNPVNDNPNISLPETFTINEDETLEVDFTPYISDPDGHGLVLTAGGNENITADINGYFVTLGALQDWNGTERLAFAVSDNQASDATAADFVDVIVIPVNDAPTIDLPVDFTFEEDGMLIEDFTPYVFDVDGDPLTLSYQIGGEIGGTVFVSIEDFDVTFTAEVDWNGTEFVEFTVDDGVTDATGSDFVDVIVTPVNDAPEIVLPDDFTFAEDGELTVDFTPYVYDVDGDMLYLDYYTGGPQENGTGTVFVSIDGLDVTFTASENWYGMENVMFEVYDDMGQPADYSAFDDVMVIVTPVNDPPVMELPDSFTFDEDGSLEIDFADYIYDIEDDPITLGFANNTNVSVEIDGMDVTLTATSNWNGSEIIEFSADDGVSDGISMQNVEIIVTPVNDPPMIALPDDFTFDEDGSLEVDFAQYISDYDPDNLSLSVDLNEMVYVDIAGLVVTFTAEEDWFGVETLEFTVNDNYTDAIAIDGVDVIVLPVNDAPVAVDDAFDAEEERELVVDAPGVLDNDYDIDSEGFTALLENPATNGNVVLNPDGSFSYTPEDGFIGDDTFTYLAYDGEDISNSATVYITVLEKPDVVDLFIDKSENREVWEMIEGDYQTGFTMELVPEVEEYYLTTNVMSSFNIPVAPDYYAFYVSEQPAEVFTYWDAYGVNENAQPGTMEAHLWLIINGQEPQFYLRLTDEDIMGHMLVDGLVRDYFGQDDYLRVKGDYPAGDYSYVGTVIGANGVESDELQIDMYFYNDFTVPEFTD